MHHSSWYRVNQSSHLLPTPQREKKLLIVESVESEQGEIDKNTSNEASSAKVDEVDKTNAANVESKDDKIDTIGKRAESQDDNAAKSERDEDPGAKIDEVADKENGQVPQVCGSEADVEQATEAPQQHQQQPLSNELLSKLSKWLTRRQQCMRWTKSRSTRRRRRCELRLHQLLRARSHKPYASSWKESASRRKPCAGTSALEHVLRMPDEELTNVAVPSTETYVCARDRTNNRLHIALPERNETQPAMTYATLCPVVELLQYLPFTQQKYQR